MELPIQFPDEQTVIDDEVARFRALSPAARRASIYGLLTAGQRMLRLSPRGHFLRNYTLEQEEVARKAFLEFVATHDK
jgi:hypothetical protein